MYQADVEAVCGYEKKRRRLAERRATVKQDVKEKAIVALTKVKVKVKYSAALLYTAQRRLWTVRKTEAFETSCTRRLCNELEKEKKVRIHY